MKGGGPPTPGQRMVEERSDLIDLVDTLKTDDLLVLCSVMIARVVLDLGAAKAAEFFSAGVASVVASLAQEAAERGPHGGH